MTTLPLIFVSNDLKILHLFIIRPSLRKKNIIIIVVVDDLTFHYRNALTRVKY